MTHGITGAHGQLVRERGRESPEENPIAPMCKEFQLLSTNHLGGRSRRKVAVTSSDGLAAWSGVENRTTGHGKLGKRRVLETSSGSDIVSSKGDVIAIHEMSGAYRWRSNHVAGQGSP